MSTAKPVNSVQLAYPVVVKVKTGPGEKPKYLIPIRKNPPAVSGKPASATETTICFAKDLPPTAGSALETRTGNPLIITRNKKLGAILGINRSLLSDEKNRTSGQKAKRPCLSAPSGDKAKKQCLNVSATSTAKPTTAAAEEADKTTDSMDSTEANIILECTDGETIETPAVSTPEKKKWQGRAKRKEDPEEWLQDHHIFLENLEHKLRTGKQKPGLDKSMKRRINKALPCFQLDEDGHLIYIHNSRFQRVLYTEEEKHEAFLKSHEGHPGVNTTYLRFSKSCYFKGMNEYIHKKVAECDHCTSRNTPKVVKPGPITKVVPPVRPRQKVGLDMIGGFERTERGFRYCVIIVDLFTKWVDFYPALDNAADTSAKIVKKYILSHGAPQSILSNRGRRFISELNGELVKMFGEPYMVTSACIQENNIMEDYRQAVKTKVTEYTKTGKYDWEGELDELAHELNTTKHRSSKQTAFSMVYGGEYRAPSQVPSVDRVSQTVVWPAEPDIPDVIEPIYLPPADETITVMTHVSHVGSETEQAIMNLGQHDNTAGHHHGNQHTTSSYSTIDSSQSHHMHLTHQDSLSHVVGRGLAGQHGYC